MMDQLHTAFGQWPPVTGCIGEIALPVWLQVSQPPERLFTIMLAFLVLLLTGILSHLRRMRLDLERETNALKKSEDHLRTMGDNLPHISIFQLMHDIPTNSYAFTFLSSGFENVLGLKSSDILDNAQLALDHVYEADIDVIKEAAATAAEQLEPAKIEIRFLDSGGAYKWLRISAIPQRADHKLVWDGFIQDISSMKEAERSMVEESRNFQNLFETIEDFLVVCDMDGKLLHSNPSMEIRLGYAHEELAEMSIFELYPQDARPDVYRIVAQLRSDPSTTCGLPLQMKSGGNILVEMNLFQGIWKHKKAIFGVARDVARYQQTESALRESQQMLQLIIDTIPMSVFWKDKDSVYLGCNNAFIEACRLNSIEEVVGRTPLDLFEESIAPGIVERDQGVINTNQALMNHLEPHTRPDGSIGWREISLIPLRNETGKAVGVLGVWRDVTEQNRAEERLKRTLDDMERFNQLMRGRERRTLELKDEINELLQELGKPRKYRTTAEDMS